MTPRLSPLAGALLVALLPSCKPAPGTPGAPDYAAQPPPPPSAAVNATELPLDKVEAFVNPTKAPVYTGPTGSLQGTVSITGNLPPEVPGQDFSKCSAGRDMYGTLFRVGGPVSPPASPRQPGVPTGPSGARTLADALVAVTGYAGGFIPERNPVKKLTFENCSFGALTIDMTMGQKLEVTNTSSRLIAPSLAQAPLPALMLAAQNTSAVKVVPLRPGYYTLVDRMELSYLHADLYAMLTPLHTVTTLDGHYRIDGIPVGNVTVNARLPMIRKETSLPVEIRANTVQTVDLTLAFNAAADVPKAPVAKPDPVQAK
jgi:hypothetical protein